MPVIPRHGNPTEVVTFDPALFGIGLDADPSPAPQPEIGRLSLITSHTPSTLGKRLRKGSDDIEVERPNNLVEGSALTVGFTDAEGLVGLLKRVRHDQALSPQVLTEGRTYAPLTTLGRLKDRPGHAARDSSNFEAVDDKGIVVVDYDPPKGGPALPKDEIWAALLSVAPGLAEGSSVWWCSSSSFIYDGEVQVAGLKGQRLYLMVLDTSDAERVLKTLNKRLWIAGHGRVDISAAGSLLVRGLCDEAMSSAARLDYCGGAICAPPLSQRRPAPEILGNGGWLDTRRAIADLSPEEERTYQRLVAEAKTAQEPAARLIREVRATAKASEIEQRLITSGVPEEVAARRARAAVDAAAQGELMGDFEITLDTGEVVTVAAVLADKARYDGVTTLDPLEPEYCGHKTVGHINAGSSAPNLYSHAHGGKTYRLRRGRAHVQLVAGERDSSAAQIAAAVAASDDTFLVSGAPSILRRIGGRDLQVVRLDSESFAERAEACVSFSRYDGRAKKVLPCDPDDGTLRRARAKLTAQNLRPLRQIVRTPIVTQSGRIVVTPGYDEEVSLFADIAEGVYRVPEVVTRAELVEAVRSIWRPFRAYEFDHAHSRAALFAATLGIVARPALGTAPGLLIDAPSSNSGKSYIGLALVALAEGREATPVAPPNFGSDDEILKSLTTFAAEGKSTLFLDNCRGHIQSTHLEALLTGRGLSGRQVGFGHSVGADWRPFVILTSNNASTNRDIARRLLKVRIEPSVKGTTDDRFTFSPEREALRTREAMLQDHVTLMKAYFGAGAPRRGKVGTDFSEWDTAVRQPILWLAAEGVFDDAGVGVVGDPAHSIREEAGVSDAESVTRTKLLYALWDFTQGYEFTSSSVLREVSGYSGPSKDTVMEALGEMGVLRGNDLPSAGTLGKVLGHLVGARYDGLTLRKRDGRANSTWWSVTGGEPLSPDSTLQRRLSA